MHNEDDGKSGYDPSPVNPLPGTVIAMFLVFFGVETVLLLGAEGLVGGPSAVGWRLQLVQDYGFSPQVFDWMVSTGQFPGEHLLRFVTFPFIHLGFVHMAIAVVIFLAMGKLVGEVVGDWVVPVVFLISGAFGAVMYALLTGSDIWLVGAYPGAYGLLGVFTFLMWAQAKLTGDNQLQAFRMIAVLMGIQWLFGLLFGSNAQWVAELGGFICGFALSVVLIPAARAALLARIRRPN